MADLCRKHGVSDATVYKRKAKVGGMDVAKKVGGLFPNDADGKAWGDPAPGLPGPLAPAGYELVDPGRCQPMNNDVSCQIAAFQAAGCDIVTGVMIPPDFATFWAQAAQLGFAATVVTIGKALLVPSAVEALGNRGDRLTTKVWWTPDDPCSSSLTGMSAKASGDACVAQSGKPWTATLGCTSPTLQAFAAIFRRCMASRCPLNPVRCWP